MLRSLAALGVIERVAAILYARPGGDIPPEQFSDYDEALLRIVRDECGRDDLPIVAGMDFGHTDPMFVLPYGALAEVDCARQVFRVVESGVV